jgi:hypothetical protein
MGLTSVEVEKFTQIELEPFNFSTDSMSNAFHLIKPLSPINTRRSERSSPAGMAQFENQINIFAKMLKHFLSLFGSYGL